MNKEAAAPTRTDLLNVFKVALKVPTPEHGAVHTLLELLAYCRLFSIGSFG
jgi:hypothetical protein